MDGYDMEEYMEEEGDETEEQWQKESLYLDLKDRTYVQELMEIDRVRELKWLNERLNQRTIEKNKLIIRLKALKEEFKVANNYSFYHNKNFKDLNKFFELDGLYHCPVCSFNAKKPFIIRKHINTDHLKVKLWKCLDCDQG